MQVRTAETSYKSSGRRRIRTRAKSAGAEEPARQVAARSRPGATLTAFTSAGFVLFVVGIFLLLLARTPTMSKVRLQTSAARPHIPEAFTESQAMTSSHGRGHRISEAHEHWIRLTRLMSAGNHGTGGLAAHVGRQRLGHHRGQRLRRDRVPRQSLLFSLALGHLELHLPASGAILTPAFRHPRTGGPPGRQEGLAQGVRTRLYGKVLAVPQQEGARKDGQEVPDRNRCVLCSVSRSCSRAGHVR